MKSNVVNAPSTVAGLSVTSSGGKNTLTWATVTGASSYTAYYSTTTGVTPSNGYAIPSVGPGFSHTGIVEGVSYFYTVVANNIAGSSEPSAQATATVAATTGTYDPYSYAQWFIANTGQNGGTVGEDMKVTTLTATTNFGEGVRVAVVDDGLEIGHEDLAINVATNQSYNYVTGSYDPTGSTGDSPHGTAVAGIIAARNNNDIGVRGIAPRANLVGYNYLQRTTAANEADAMVRGASDVWVSNNSWGPTDCTGQVSAATSTWKSAIDYGLANGRGGKGTVYVWAAGNGANHTGSCGAPANERDNANYDGYGNYYGVISVCGVGDNGGRAVYSEKGANLWVCGRTQRLVSTGNAMVTTDLTGSSGYNSVAGRNYATIFSASDTGDYTNAFNGTSAAAPTVAGAVALMLKNRPALTWRDVKYALAKTASSLSDTGWHLNGGGFWVNHNFGFGAVDTDRAAAYSSTMTLLGSMTTYDTGSIAVNGAIPDNTATGVASTLSVAASGITKMEFAEVTFSSTNHTASGDLKIQLISPSSTTSDLAEPRDCTTSGGAITTCSVFNGWVFGSARVLDEPADGTWILRVIDSVPGDTGTFQNWRLKIYGRN